MKRLVILLLVGMVLVGCGYQSTSITRAVNRDNLNKLEMGMTGGQVKDLMGKPYKKEAIDGRAVWYYDTGLRRDEQGVHHETLTPLRFEEGRLVKWGKVGTI